VRRWPRGGGPGDEGVPIVRRGKRARRRPWQELHDRRRQGIFLFPALLTTGNLFCGFFAMLLAVDHRYTEAAIAIFVAMVMDLLDGRVARLMKATSQFGVEYDSLADVISFCVAPAFLLYSFALHSLGRAAWFGAFLFLVCGALRLARFNVQTATTDRRFFIGLSTPAAAGVAASMVILLEGEEPTRAVRVSIAVMTYVLALLMVSTFRYWSFKEVDFARRRPVETLLVVVLAVMIVATMHEVFLFLAFGAYAFSGPVRRVLVGRPPAPSAEPASAKEPH
jgi:CDP-diacylglycerol---serine O-phosphatidyltransferase